MNRNEIHATIATTILMLTAAPAIAAVADTTPPVIKLKGSDSVTIQVGESYKDAGATASDDVDGDISASVRMVSTLDTSKPGTYAVAFNVNDAAGNAAKAVYRFVKVVEAAAEPAAEAPAAAPAEPVAEPVAEQTAEQTAETAAEPASETVVETPMPAEDETAPAAEPVAAPAADTRPPAITLRGESSVMLNVGDSYSDAGATAWDKVDGSITNRIRTSGTVDTTRPGVYIISYSVSDRAGNAAKKVSRYVTVVRPADTTPPVITLKGSETVTIVEDDAYIDAGATAVDDNDGDISDKLEKGGAVFTSRAGTYALKYFVSDRAGNQAIAERKIVVTARGNPDAGRQLAQKKCSMCHEVESTDHKYGPGLLGVYNRKAGSASSFSYSNALSAGGWSWDKDSLKTWLGQNSKDAVKQLTGDPGASTKMKFKGLSGNDLDDIIAFLKRND